MPDVFKDSLIDQFCRFFKLKERFSFLAFVRFADFDQKDTPKNQVNNGYQK